MALAAGEGHSCSSLSQQQAGLCSGVRVKQHFLITQGLCWARMGLEGGMDGRSRDSTNLINQVRNQPCKNPSRLAATSSRPPRARLVLSGTPPPSLVSPCIQEQPGAVGEVGCNGGHRASGSRDRVSVTPSEHRSQLRPRSPSPVHPQPRTPAEHPPAAAALPPL